MKSFKFKIFFKSRGREVCSYAHNCTGWKDDSHLFTQNSPAPSCKLLIGNVAELFVLWPLIGISILLFILCPCCAEDILISTNGLKSWVLSDALWRTIRITIWYNGLACFHHLINFLTANTFINAVHILTATTGAPMKQKKKTLLTGFLTYFIIF